MNVDDKEFTIFCVGCNKDKMTYKKNQEKGRKVLFNCVQCDYQVFIKKPIERKKK